MPPLHMIFAVSLGGKEGVISAGDRSCVTVVADEAASLKGLKRQLKDMISSDCC